jgi:hypothetical protein
MRGTMRTVPIGNNDDDDDMMMMITTIIIIIIIIPAEPAAKCQHRIQTQIKDRYNTNNNNNNNNKCINYIKSPSKQLNNLARILGS